jgi:hypothetical protein
MQPSKIEIINTNGAGSKSEVTVDMWIARIFLQGSPLGFQGGDANLYRYAANNAVNHVDPSGLEVAGMGHLYPLYLGGSYDQPVFDLTEAEHTAAHDVLRNHGLGERASDRSYDPARAAWRNMTPAQQRAIIIESMRAANIPENLINQHIDNIVRGSDPGINRSPGRPSGYRAGQVVSRTSIQQARGNTAPRIGTGGQPTMSRPATTVRTMTARAAGALTVYITLRDALAATGHNGMNLEPINSDYYFTAADGSVFIVQFYHWPSSIFNDDRRLYVAGPRRGQTEVITSAQVDAYREEAERVWGRYIPGGLLSSARFIAGTQRRSVPITDWLGREIGYIDATGPHYSYPIGPGSI